MSAVLRIPPAALMGALIAGVCNTGVTSQMPLYAQDLQPGSGASSAATLYIAAMIGGTITQWPAGSLSDRIDRRLIVAALSAIALGACLALYLTAGRVSFSITVLLAAAWGAGALSFYSVSAAHATDRTASGQIAQVMSGMLFVWAGGSVLGPVLTGAVADTQAGQPGVFAAVSVGYFALLAANLWPLVIRPQSQNAKRSPFRWLAATSLVQGKVVQEGDPASGGEASERPSPPHPGPGDRV